MTAGTDTVALAHERHGPADGSSVVLLHGLGAQRAWWPVAFVARLAEDHDVVLPDLRDSGRSPSMDHLGSAGAALTAWSEGRDPVPPYTLADVAADVVRLLDELGIDRAHVVGASMGGMVAQHLAFGHPDRVVSLTSIMSTTGAPDVPPGDPEVLGSLSTPAPTDSEEAYLAHALASARASSNSPLFDEQDARRRYGEYWRVGTNPAGSGRQLVAVIDDGDRTERLRSVTAPTLVVHGDRDPMLHLEGGRATAAAVPGATLLELSDVGHELPSAVHAQVHEAIVAHIARADDRRAARP